MSSRSVLTVLTFVGVCSGTTDESAIVRRRDAGLDPEPPPLPPPLNEVAKLSGRVLLRVGVVVRSFGDGGAAARGIGNRPRIEPVDVRGRLGDRESGDSSETSGSLSGSWGNRPAGRFAEAIGLGNGFADFPGKTKEGGATRERRRSCPSSACSRPLPLSAEEKEVVPVGPNVLVAHRGRFEFELEPGAVLLLTLSPAVGARR
jgi:hypothetical protein